MLTPTAGVTPARALDRIRVMGAAPKLASSRTGSLLKTRVGGIDLASPHRIGVRRDVAPRSRWGNRLCRHRLTAGSGRYLSEDPALTDAFWIDLLPYRESSGAGVKPYSYGLNNPLRFEDTNGYAPSPGGGGGSWAGAAVSSGNPYAEAAGLAALAAAAAMTATRSGTLTPSGPHMPDPCEDSDDPDKCFFRCDIMWPDNAARRWACKLICIFRAPTF